MLISYLESIKYVGHLWPVAFVRILLGFQFLSSVTSRVQAGYLQHAYISEKLDLSEGATQNSSLYFDIFKNLVQTQWLPMTYLLLTFEVIIGLSYIFGFGVFP